MAKQTKTFARARSGKSGQKPFFLRSTRQAAKVAGRRRARRKSKTPNWLRAWPTGSNQGNKGNYGQAPRYVKGHQPEKVK